MLIKYRHIDNPDEIRTFDTRAAFKKIPEFFKSGRTQEEYDRWERAHFEKDLIEGVVLEWWVEETKEAS